MLRSCLLFCLIGLSTTTAVSQSFSWDNAIVYWVMIDRFANGDPSNDHSYGRALGPNGEPIHQDSPARYAGGDLAGLTRKVADGYFDELGVNAIWISSPVEQVHGWVGGESGAYPAYPYHGYWPLDFTSIDANLGTEEDFRHFVDTCHERGIRVIMDVVINHAGYNTLADMSSYEFGAIKSDDWVDWRPGQGETWQSYHDRFIDYSDSSAWRQWWGPDWIRANIGGYDPCGTDDRTTCTSSLPDFKTESSAEVGLPVFLQTKWKMEARFDSTGATALRAPVDHLIHWITGWVRDYGVDGFRLDTAINLDLATISRFSAASARAFEAWKQQNPDKAIDDEAFWIVGEVFGHGVERTEYFDAGLKSVINFSFQEDISRDRLRADSIFSSYSSAINSDRSFNVLSYASSHDTRLFDRSRMREAATYLMLLPGSVQLFYGDETGRTEGPEGAIGTDRTRSFMNWDRIDEPLLEHWRKLGQFRRRHPSIAMGSHALLDHEPLVFARSLRSGTYRDQVVVVLGATGKTRVNVSAVFADNTILRDAYSGKTTFVSYGMVYVEPLDNGPILLEEVH